MKNYVPENTQKNRVRGYRILDWLIFLVVIVSISFWFMRNQGVPSQKELLVIERQVEILKLQQAQGSLKYDLGVQQQQTRGLVLSIEEVQQSIEAEK